MIDQSYFERLSQLLEQNACPAETTVQYSQDLHWILVNFGNRPAVGQGWKIRVSASPNCVDETLSQCVPILANYECDFKICATPEKLIELNGGGGSLSQIGKFLTVYPRSTPEFREVAKRLDVATLNTFGPIVPFDYRLSKTSAVYYRYGAFVPVYLKNAQGEVLPCVRSTTGKLVTDDRADWHRNIPNDDDPFKDISVKSIYRQAPRIIGKQYLTIGLIHQSARGNVYLVLDLDTRTKRIAKQATLQRVHGADLLEPSFLLKRELDVLRALSNELSISSNHLYLEEDGNGYLIEDYIEGDTLEDYVMKASLEEGGLSWSRVVDLAIDIASRVSALHKMGYVYRDLKSTNILVSYNKSVFLIDFDTCAPVGSPGVPGLGTRGYQSPQQKLGSTAQYSDDIYSLGAILHFIATGAEPSMCPSGGQPFGRPIHLYLARENKTYARIVEKCLQSKIDLRYNSASVVHQELLKLRSSGIGFSAPQIRLADRETDSVAFELYTTLESQALKEPGTLKSAHPLSYGILSRDVNTGLAGIAISLCDFFWGERRPQTEEVLRSIAGTLVNPSRIIGDELPGLYVGEAGVAVALCRMGVALKDRRFIEQAVEQSAKIAKLPYDSPDLFNGAAGRLRAHLLLYAASGDDQQLQYALDSADFILSMQRVGGHDEHYWEIPDGFGGLSGKRYIGYAHGIAGIVDALLDLYSIVPSSDLSQAIQNGKNTLISLSTSVLSGRGFTWASEIGGTPAAPYWCHGSGGIARFLMRYARYFGLDSNSFVAEKAISTVCELGRWARPSYCHGLAGSLDIILDASPEFSNERLDDCAKHFSALISEFLIRNGDTLKCESEKPYLTTPDYMLGTSGIARVLYRHTKRPHWRNPLSLEGYLRND